MTRRDLFKTIGGAIIGTSLRPEFISRFGSSPLMDKINVTTMEYMDTLPMLTDHVFKQSPLIIRMAGK